MGNSSVELCSHNDIDGERDVGNTLTEIVVCVALIGITVVAVLSGLTTVVRASTIDRDQAQSFEWLQAASDAIFLSDRVPCTNDGTGRAQALADYNAAAQTASTPPVWVGTGATIEVVNVEYLGRSNVDDDFEWGPGFCFEGGSFADSPLHTQRITIQVNLPSSDATQTLEMVKSER